VLEPLRGLRVVADPVALDIARWVGTEVIVLRFAPDDALAIGATGVDLADPHAIVEPDAGFAGAWLPLDEVARHIEWPLPPERPALAQGAVAGVPAKVFLPDGIGIGGGGVGDVLLLTATAYADELTDRLR
jgi:hypothetical protein